MFNSNEYQKEDARGAERATLLSPKKARPFRVITLALAVLGNVPLMALAASVPASSSSSSTGTHALHPGALLQFAGSAPLLVAVATVLLLVAALFGCIARKAAATADDGEGREHEFWSDASGPGTPKQPTPTEIKIDKLGAVYITLGKVSADVAGYEKQLASLEKALETTRFPDILQLYTIDPMKKKLAHAKAAAAKFANDAVEMRAKSAESVMPEVKACEALYASIFEAEMRGPAGVDAAAAICSKVLSLQAGLAPAPTDGTKAARQPDQPLETLQREGVQEAKKMHGEAMAALEAAGIDREQQLQGSSVCSALKSAGRGFEKVYARWGGDFRAVSDWGRATVSAVSLVLLASVLELVLTHLVSLGYTVVAVKNTLDLAKDCTVNGGYRNLMLNLKCPGSGHVVELQFNLAPIEEVKQTRGHAVFELLRRCGFSAENSLVQGGWTANMDSAIRSGMAVELGCGQTNWDAADAAGLQSALNSPGCRVVKVAAFRATGEGVGAMAVACLSSSAPIKSINLSDNKLGPEAWMEVVKALATNQTVQTICLGGNMLGPEAGKELAKTLATNQTVQTIKLDNNNLGPEAGKELAKVLTTNQAVQKIVLNKKNDFDAETKEVLKKSWGDRDISNLSL